eukprot:Ihof_evm10s105 gene=Ihof_evmTU10s105
MLMMSLKQGLTTCSSMPKICRYVTIQHFPIFSPTSSNIVRCFMVAAAVSPINNIQHDLTISSNEDKISNKEKIIQEHIEPEKNKIENKEDKEKGHEGSGLYNHKTSEKYLGKGMTNNQKDSNNSTRTPETEKKETKKITSSKELDMIFPSRVLYSDKHILVVNKPP